MPRKLTSAVTTLLYIYSNNFSIYTTGVSLRQSEQQTISRDMIVKSNDIIFLSTKTCDIYLSMGSYIRYDPRFPGPYSPLVVKWRQSGIHNHVSSFPANSWEQTRAYSSPVRSESRLIEEFFEDIRHFTREDPSCQKTVALDLKA